MKRTPRAERAVKRIGDILARFGGESVIALLQILVDIASEAARKQMGL